MVEKLLQALTSWSCTNHPQYSGKTCQQISRYMPERISKDIEPWFSEPIPNVTVAEGRSVTLPCVVEYLGNYKLAWIHKDRHILLTLHEKVITRNPRVTIFHNNHRTWWLNIANVELTDQGQYMCQINTAPMKSQVGFLTVVVPPSIDEDFTSSDMSVREGADSVSLRCRASGSPEPDIKWRREDDRDIVIGPKRASTISGQFLTIRKISRQHMGAYLCIASNGVPPTVSKRIMLNVNFSPMILIPNQLIWAPLRSDVTLICNLESHPRAISYWVMTGGIVIISNDKYDVLTEQTSIYKVKLSLHIRYLRPGDFGDYTCVAKNSLGDNEGTITLFEKPSPVTYESSEEQIPSASQSHMDKFTNDELMPVANNIKQDVTKRTETKMDEVEQTYMSAGVHQKNSFPGMHGNTNSSVIHLLNSSVLTLLVLLYILL